jgi:nucleotide-binding universal stress UspA family protein
MRLLALRTLLVATDLDHSSSAALETARRLADASGASLHVVHVEATLVDDARSREIDQRIDAVLRTAGLAVNRSNVHRLSGNAADAIVALASRLTADVVVLGPHRSTVGGNEHPLGSTAFAVASASPVPCLITGRPLALPLERVLVPSDLSATARGALIVGLTWASALRGSDTTLTALHVESGRARGEAAAGERGIETELDVARRHAGDWAGVTVTGRTTSGPDAARAILETAAREHADLIVLGTRGMGLDAAAGVGSVSASVARTATEPLLLVPPATWRAHAAEPMAG